MKIYCFVNSGAGTSDQEVVAVCECGDGLAGHLSSSKSWAMHDIGVTSEWKHNHYQKHSVEKHSGEPFETEWIDDPENHQALQELFKRLDAEEAK